MNGKDYERHAASYLRSHGYRHVKLTGNSGDYGVDITATRHRHKYAVQCKYYSKPVGVSAVQQVVGGMAYYACDRAMVITNNSFTRQARELAEMNDVVLLEHIRSSGKLRRALLTVLYFLSLSIFLFTEYAVIAGCVMGASLMILLFVFYLRRQAIKAQKITQECSTE